MSAYPTFTYNPAQSSTEEVLDDVQVDRASNGAAKGRAFYTTPKLKFTVVHEALTSAEKATLMTFYNDNRLLEVDFTWAADSVTYTVIFSAAPKPMIAPGLRWTVTTELEQV